jgi:predicted nucleic-acid-binding protein
MELDVWIEFDDNSASPYFPDGHGAFYKVADLINSGKFETGYIDSITRYVFVPKEIILNLVNSLDCNLDHTIKRRDELYKLVDELANDKLFKLVQQEF